MRKRDKRGGKLGRPTSVTPPPEGHRVPQSIRAEIDRVENEEALARQLSREMHDFFEDARRMAADILSNVHDDDGEKNEKLSLQMNDFLHHAAGRVQEFKDTLAPAIKRGEIATGPAARIRVEEPEDAIEIGDGDGDGEADDELLDGVETLITLSGDAEDESDSKHFGNDSWVAPTDGAHPHRAPHDAPADAAPLDFAIELESVLEADLGETLADWCTRLGHDDRKLRDALKHLVHEGFMEKQEAMMIYEAVRRTLG